MFDGAVITNTIANDADPSAIYLKCMMADATDAIAETTIVRARGTLNNILSYYHIIKHKLSTYFNSKVFLFYLCTPNIDYN